MPCPISDSLEATLYGALTLPFQNLTEIIGYFGPDLTPRAAILLD
jgi:hypothetical protein